MTTSQFQNVNPAQICQIDADFPFFLTSWDSAHMLNYVKRPIRDIYTRNCVFV